MSNRNFLQIPSHMTSVRIDPELLTVLEPIRDSVQRRFQGQVSDERVITRGDLIRLGLATREQLDVLGLD